MSCTMVLKKRKKRQGVLIVVLMPVQEVVRDTLWRLVAVVQAHVTILVRKLVGLIVAIPV